MSYFGTMEAGAQELIEGNFHILATSPREEAAGNAEAEKTGEVGLTAEVAMIGAAVWSDACIPNEDQPLHPPSFPASQPFVLTALFYLFRICQNPCHSYIASFGALIPTRQGDNNQQYPVNGLSRWPAYV